ncbi:hypothetical protein [Palleronia sp. LCG004]|uniref:hypothetical protein n=1 Tax=Palleronia sp. LCG004 TaxID=3079304 RepID=UPI002941F594|nr:hypothetical protein [Palleronia sp. LCG004]WOI56122.1 hypothetical protein RVY76_13985 [Palleronia sp. LCG004]
MRIVRGMAVAVMAVAPMMAMAEETVMAPRGSLFSDRAPLFVIDDSPSEPEARLQVASLFADRAETGFFAPRSEPARVTNAVASAAGIVHQGGTPVAQLRHIIARAEAGSMEYDAVQHGATRKPSRPPTQMTLADIYEWIAATPGQPHAIGRYQFIPKTLKALVNRAGLDTRTRFSPEVQDQLANLLLEDAGLTAFRAGQITRHAFMNNLAKIWAGLPNSSGQSHYHGYAGNKATMSWANFDAEVAALFPG